MKTIITAALCFLVATTLFPQEACHASLFEMILKQDSIYTPGKIHLAMKLTDKAKYDGHYQFQVNIYMAGTLIRKRTFTTTRKNPVVFELTFPEVFSRTDGRCRCDLFIGEVFIEAREKSLTLWPPISPFSEESIKNKEIWTFDTSGKLQELFNELEVKCIDATFQPARDFGSPDIVFIGPHIDPNRVRIVTKRLISVQPKPVVIYLKQKHFLKETKIEVPTENNISQTVKFNRDNPFLIDLNFHDILSLVDKAHYLKIRKEDNADRTIRSYIYEKVQDEKNIFSYLLTTQEKEQFSIYCQLPVTDGNDPRYVILLKNILKFADNVSDEIIRKDQASY